LNKEWNIIARDERLYKDLLWEIGEVIQLVPGQTYREEYISIARKRVGKEWIDGILKCLRCYRMGWAHSIRKHPRIKYGCPGGESVPRNHKFWPLEPNQVLDHLIKGYTFLS